MTGRWRRLAVGLLAPVVAVTGALAGGPAPAQATPAAPAVTPVQYTYDAAGRLASVTDTTGARRSFTYDAVGNLTGVSTAAATSATPAAAAPDRPITGLRATAATVGGRSSVVLTGTGLPAASTAAVKVGGLFAPVRSSDGRRLVADVPPGVGGTVAVSVVGDDGTVARTSTSLPAARATATQDGGADPAAPPALVAPDGVTAVSGLVRNSANGHGLAGIHVRIDDRSGRTDAQGRFLISGVPSGHHELLVQGGADFGTYEVGVEAVRGRTTPMAWTTWLTRLDRSHVVRLPATVTREIVVTTPAIPGLEVHVPPGTTLTDADGKPVRELSITKLPGSRQPFPGAPGMRLVWTLQPGSAVVGGQGLWVVYPNLAGQPRGAVIDYVSHDADGPGTGWSVYGHGRVTNDGKQIRPDASTRLHETYQLGVSYNPLCQYLGIFCPKNGDNDNDGDPVDLGTGLFVFSHTDLAMPDVVPIELTRTYRQRDYVIRSFGMGQSDAFDSFVSPDGAGHYVVQLPNGASVPFSATSDPTVYLPVSTPSSLTGSRMVTDNHRNFTVTMATGQVLDFGGETASLISIGDRYGNATTMDRDSSGRLLKVTSPNGRWISLTWGACTSNGTQCVVAAADSAGRAVSYGYDASGRLTSSKDVASGTTSYVWVACADSLTCTEMTSITDPLGQTFVTNGYDAQGRVTTQRLADGSAYTFAYTLDANGRVTSTVVSDPLGNQRQTTFDGSGYTSSDTRAFGTSKAATSSYVRDSSFRVTQSTDPLSRATAFTYDPNGNLLTQTSMAGTAQATTVSLTYEPTYQRIATVVNALGKTGTFTYDDSAGTVKVTDPVGNTQTTRIVGGQPVSVTDALGHTSYTSYLDGLPVASVDNLGRTWRSYFDGAGRLLKSTDPLGQRTKFAYDVAGDTTKVTDPTGAVSTGAYDAGGQLRTLTDALGHTTSYSYDALGHLVTRTDALGRIERFGYDATGNLTSRVDKAGVRSLFKYDAFGHLTFAGYKATGSGASTTYESSITNTFDAVDRLTKAVDSLTGTVSRSYDNLDHVLSETTPQGTVTYTYDAGGRRTTMTPPGVAGTTYTYDANDLLTKITSAQGVVTLGYDANERPTSVSLPGGTVQTTTYDAAGRQSGITYTGAAGTLGTLTYGYDRAGQRTSVGGTFARVSLPPVVASSTYDATNALTSRGGQTFAYDANGRLTSDGSRTYTWSARGLLTSVTGSGSATFTYDALGRRQTRATGGTTTGFVYDGANLLQERVGSSATANLVTGRGLDQTLLRSDAGGTSGLLTDALGSTVALATASGATSTSYTYDPYGAPTASGPASSNPLQFTGRESDGTGLQYNRARYYSPSMQRFISPDPAGVSGSGTNLYAYAGDSPTQAVDPSGLQLLPGCLIGAAINVGIGWGTSALLGSKYTFGDGLADAALGCALGAVGAWVGELGAAARAGEAADEGVSLSLKYKDGWTAEQRAAADAKVAALNDADLAVTQSERSGTSAASRYRSSGGDIPPGSDVDHVVDLQLGGADDILNMRPLDASVNRSLGAQIANQIRGLEPGTRICSVTICAR